MKIENLFFELIQVAIGQKERLSRNPSNEEWAGLYAMAYKQSLVGIVFYGIERLPKEQLPSKEIIFQWMGDVSTIENRNSITTEACQKLCQQLENDGFRCCVLKGQANHAYYPSELRNRRTCGDIDVWTVPREGRSKKEDVRRILEYLKEKHELTGLCWLHANITGEHGVPVEVHFYPSFMNSPVKNRRFLKYFHDMEGCTCKKDIDGVVIPAMKIEYDVIYQMNHIYRHLIDEGVGLRQVIDYYFLLKHFNEVANQARNEVIQIVKRLGMKRFARALMWVLGIILAMPQEWMLCNPVEKDGRFLLNEIMMAGNFGQTDPRMAALDTSGNKLRIQVKRSLRRIKRNLRFLTSYPGEVIWEPFSRIYHFAWKQLKLWRI